MMSRYMLLAATMALLLCAFAQAQDAPPPPPISGPPPALSRGPEMVRPLMIGPNSSTAIARTIRGKVAATANPPREINPATVELFVDEKSIGSASQKPYMHEFDTTTIPDGEHMFKAVARDGNSAEVWNASVKVLVRNAEGPGPSNPGYHGAAPSTMPVGGPPPGFGSPGPPPPIKAPGIPPLDKLYTSAKYGLSIRYPSGWVVLDQTPTMKPKTPGGFWLVFGTEPIGKSTQVVNLRRRKLESNTDADTFARYNKYVLKWERKTVLGATAFATTTGSPAAKRVTHRLILIKDGNAWMFNCIDTTGGTPDKSRSLLEAMVNTLVQM